MPAPTALIRAPEKLAEEDAITSTGTDSMIGDQSLIQNLEDTNGFPVATQDAQHVVPQDGNGHSAANTEFPSAPAATQTDPNADPEDTSRPTFPPDRASKSKARPETRKVLVPPHRMTPLKQYAWAKMYPPLVQHLKLQLRMNPARKTIELRTSHLTTDENALQKGQDFINCFCLGFDVDDAVALLRLDDLYIQTFQIKDVKMLSGEHLSRAIGRIAGKDAKMKFAIENSTKTRISLEGQTVHILGGFKNINIAREAVVSLILGSPPGKVYGNLRTVAARMKERF